MLLRYPQLKPADERQSGSITIHHCRTVHGSMPNNSSKMRPLLINAYSSADALTITSHPAPCKEALPGGKPSKYAEFDSDPCPLPPDWSGGYTSIFAAQQERTTTVAAYNTAMIVCSAMNDLLIPLYFYWL